MALNDDAHVNPNHRGDPACGGHVHARDARDARDDRDDRVDDHGRDDGARAGVAHTNTGGEQEAPAPANQSDGLWAVQRSASDTGYPTGVAKAQAGRAHATVHPDYLNGFAHTKRPRFHPPGPALPSKAKTATHCVTRCQGCGLISCSVLLFKTLCSP